MGNLSTKGLVKVLSSISSSIELGFSDNEVLHTVSQKTCKEFGFKAGFVSEYDKEEKTYTLIEDSWYSK